jgi:flagellar biosynthetic protein FlhB
MAWDVAVGSLLFLGAMAAIDVVYQRWRFEKRLRMSKKEIRDELKGDRGSSTD